MQLTLPVLAVLAAAALDLIIAGIIAFQNPRSAVNLSFMLFALSGTCWGAGISFFLAVSDPFWLDFFARFLYVGGSGVTITFFYFALVFRNNSWPSWQKTCFVFAPLIILGILYFFTDLLIVSYLITPTGLHGFKYGNLHYFFDIVLWGFFAAALYTYINIFRSSDTQTGRQALVIMIGTAMNVSLATATNIVGPSFFNYFDHLWVGPFFMIIWVLSVAYAIFRYQLFSVRVIAAELFIISLWIFLLIRLFISSSEQDFWINSISFLISLILGLFVIRSVINEVNQRELIEAQEKELEIANQQQTSLLHFISHEIKGYLTKSEAAFAGIIEGDFGQVEEGVKKISQSALMEVRKGVSTVMDILDASNLKKGTVSYAKKFFDLKQATEDVIAELKPTADDKHLTIKSEVGVGSYTLIGDEDKLRRHVIRNLIDNAIKYTPRGSIQVTLTHTRESMRLTIQDSGVGITPEDMARLFTEGGHGKDSIKVNAHSTGYGLYIAKQVVEAHKGKIWAESDGQGKGSRFIIEFPTT